MPKLKAGDVFAIPIPDLGFLTGRVLMDSADAIKRKLVKRGSRFWFLGGPLVEIYAEVSQEPSAVAGRVLISSIWTDTYLFEKRNKPTWTVIGNHPVDPVKVEYPERLLNSDRGALFHRGEIEKVLPVPYREVEHIGCSTYFEPTPRVWRIALYYLGRQDLLGERAPAFTLTDSDLRFSPHREEIYRLLGEDPARNYWDWAMAEGLDPGRFWR